MVGALLLSVAHASGLGLAPAVIELDVRPGMVRTENIRVTNRSARPVEVRAYVEDLWYDEDGSFAYLPQGTGPRSAGVLASVTPERFALGVRESKPVELQIRVPDDAVGGRYGVAFFEVVPEQGTFASMRMGTVFLLDSVGGVEPSINAEPARVAHVDGRLKAEVPVRVQGDHHVAVTFKGVVRSASDKRVATRLTSRETKILPGQLRTVSALETVDLEPGPYLLDGVLVGEGVSPTPVQQHFSIR